MMIAFDAINPGAYKMGSRPKGHALIINIRSYVNDIEQERLGSEHDVKSLKMVLSQLGYKTHFVENEKLNDKELKNEIRSYSEMTEHRNCDSTIVVLMTHGAIDPSSNLVVLKTYNGKEVFLKDLTDMFSAGRCPSLANKPKLFFIQVCRGNMPHARVSVNGTALQTDGASMDSPFLVRNHADMLIGHATIHGYVAYRHILTGSWFIQELCKALARLAHNTDLSTIMENVDLNVSSMEKGQFAQTTETMNYLSKKVYFNPGLYDNDDGQYIS